MHCALLLGKDVLFYSFWHLFPACIHVHVNKLFSCYVPVQYNIIIPASSTNSLHTVSSCTHYNVVYVHVNERESKGGI